MDDTFLDQLKHIPILCVEDEPGLREVIVETLRYYFHDVYEAKDGIEGYEMYLEHAPKIILSDIQMPNASGIELVRRIRKDDHKTAIIMLTAYSNEEYLMELINLGVNYFILKPLNLKKLDEALLKYLHDSLAPLTLVPGLVLNLQKRGLEHEGGFIALRHREQTFLQLLHERKNAFLAYEDIEAALWQDKEMTTHALKSFIKELRGKLPFNIIKNIPQAGYTLDKGNL